MEQPGPAINTLVNITGRVTSVRDFRSCPKNTAIFTVVTPKSGHRFTVTYVGFCPVRAGDVIDATCVVTGKMELTVHSPPLIKAPADKDSLLNIFRLTSLRENECHKLYACLQNLWDQGVYGKITDLPEVLSAITERWSKSRDDSVLTVLTSCAPLDKIKKLVEWWRKSYDMRKLYLMGLTRTEIFNTKLPLVDLYAKLIDNPYTVPQISIEKCQEIDLRTGRRVSPTDLLCGNIIRVIYFNMEKKGWSCTPLRWLSRKFSNLETVTVPLTKEFNIVFDTIVKGQGDTATTIDVAYNRRAYNAETMVANFITARMSAPGTKHGGIRSGPIVTIVDPVIENPLLDEHQIEAVKMSLSGGISIVTGGAGKGKTTVIKEIVKHLDQANIPYAICSFTGKAVYRVKEVVPGSKPATMHRMIASPNKFPQFKHLIIDECSMVTTELFYDLLLAFGTDFSVSLIGDANQLPPIGWGSLFNEILVSKRVNKTVLKINHRVYDVPGEEDGIILNCERIAKWKEGTPYIFHPTNNFVTIPGNETIVLSMVQTFHKHGLQASDIVILSPYNRFLDQINKGIQIIFNGNEQRVTDPRGFTWHINDRVMMTVNNYDIDVMNGETGIVVAVGNNSITVDFGEKRKVNIPFEVSGVKSDTRPAMDTGGEEDAEELTTRSLKLAYAMSVHRSQGSEWPVVFYFIPENSNTDTGFLNKHLTYTASSRGKRAVYFMGDIMAAAISIGKGLPYRSEFLSNRLMATLPEIPEVIEYTHIDVYVPEDEEYPPDFDCEWD